MYAHCLQEYCVTEFLRMSGVYWCLTAMDLVGQLERMNKDQVLAFVKECQKPSGGFSPAPEHDAHLLYTLSAIQVNVLHTCNTAVLILWHTNMLSVLF